MLSVAMTTKMGLKYRQDSTERPGIWNSFYEDVGDTEGNDRKIKMKVVTKEG